MKSIFVFLLLNFVCFNVHGQAEKKINYELGSNGRRYIISFNSEKPISTDARRVIGRFLDEQWLNNTYYSIVEQSISVEKLSKLIGNGGHVDISFSITGKVLKIRMYIPKENLDVLDECDLYTLYSNLQKFDMDMSKIRIEYPPNWQRGAEAFWGFTFPLKRR